jgi:hypothetical protein
MLAVVAAAAALAAPHSIMQDDTLLLRSGPDVRDRTLVEMRALGADTVRVVVTPTVSLPVLDGLVAASDERGLRLLLTPTGRARSPSPAAYGRFVRQLGRRYPDQRLWAIWNEPNVWRWLAPQFDRRGRPASPAHYRRLVRAAVRGLRASGHRRDTVLVGELASVGQVRRSRVMAPELFIRRLFRSRVPGTDFALHPYTMGASGPVCARGSRGQLPPARLARLRSLVPRRFGIWLTEAGFQSDPPDRIAGVPLGVQAARMNQLEWLATRRRVRATAQYLLVDDRERGGFQSGLRFASGRAKPALAAYRIPIWIQGRNLWARVRPAEGRERVELLRRGRVVRRLTTNRAGVVRARVGRGPWRLRWNGFTSRAATGQRSCTGAR